MERDDELPTREELWAGINALLKGSDLPESVAGPDNSTVRQKESAVDNTDDEYDRDPKNELTDRLMRKTLWGIPSARVDPRSAVSHLINSLESYKRILMTDIVDFGGPNVSQQLSIIKDITLRNIADHTSRQSKRYQVEVGRMMPSDPGWEKARNLSDYYTAWVEVTEHAAHESGG